jgi:hypothetical protein
LKSTARPAAEMSTTIVTQRTEIIQLIFGHLLAISRATAVDVVLDFGDPLRKAERDRSA